MPAAPLFTLLAAALPPLRAAGSAAEGAPRLRAARRLDDGVWTPPPPPTIAPLPTIAPPMPVPWPPGSEYPASGGGDDGHREHGDEEYDCEAGLSSWRTSWGDAKKAWCCAHEEAGCDDPDKGEKKGKRGADNQAKKEGKDSDSKKDDKAEEEQSAKRTPSSTLTSTVTSTETSTATSTSTVPTTITQTTTTTNTCHEECVIDGSASTCTDQIQQSSLTDYLGDPDSCGLAQKVVAKQCPICGRCPAKEAGCGVLELPPTQAPTTTLLPSQTPCDSVCSLGGQPATCKARMIWVADNIYQANDDSCKRAHDLVINQCHEVCSSCTLEDTGCVDPEAAQAQEVAFDCDEDPKDLSRWSAAKKSWCCKHTDKGCEYISDAEGFKKKFDDTLGPRLVDRVTTSSAAAAAASRAGVPALLMMLAAVVGVSFGRRALAAARARSDGRYFGLGDPPRVPPAACD